VSDFTKRYQTESDLYLEFVGDCVESVDDQRARLSLKQVWEIFKLWFKESYPNTKMPSKNELKKQLDTKLGELPKGSRGWQGMQIKEQHEEEGWDDAGTLPA
jgi:hypothetical protein